MGKHMDLRCFQDVGTRETLAGLRQAVTSLVYKLSTNILFEPDLRLHFENYFL